MFSRLLQPGIGVGGSHGLNHIRGGEKAHSTEKDEEDGAQDQARLGERPRKGKSSHTNDQIEDVDTPKLQGSEREGQFTYKQVL